MFGRVRNKQTGCQQSAGNCQIEESAGDEVRFGGGRLIVRLHLR